MARKNYSVASFPPPPPRYIPPPSTPVMKTPLTHPSYSLSRTLMEGFAFGTGSSIARETMSRILDTSSSSKINNNISDKGNNKEPKQCEQILSQLKDCFQMDHNMYGHLVDTYLLECHNNWNV
jgi:hypothetical protein